MAMNGVKMEGLKQDPDSGFMDDDFYEDTGELSIPPPHSLQEFWLTRVPDWLLKAWEHAGVDDEIEIGKIAIKRNTMGNEQMKMLLNPGALNLGVAPKDVKDELKDIPREYNVAPISNADDVNTYIFTEKDLPGYKPAAFGRSRTDMGGQGQYRVQKPRSKFRKAIPKHTSLVGTPSRILECIPENLNADTQNFLAKRTKKAIQGNNSKTNITDFSAHSYADGERTQKAFMNFVDVGGKRKARQENKAARIPKNELLDQLHRLFDTYEYWAMKELKKRTRQPEAYLKETLNEIAALVKSGPYAAHWKRNSDLNPNAIVATIADKPPESKSDDDIGDEDEDEMEDVV
ncbi:uncharacterized protein BDZ99DRAFT_528280 [Mytilinidion resinicola]|uniref:Transcription initiation factor IIF subunit beta n=1 Tax=Mytilinidion resinicola TaxID=574789 RepID=A0A6A6Y000_9PEZI|nr:uncharacterized protein BDZ99DRAFT_528280 [Mytilinidion resinicola]KAF2801545.1 hypothetical protein BDZ99DRAFT_528280 [Mytilinidion resinicola]